MQNIWAVGRNYAEHAKELGNSVPNSIMIFLKAGSCATTSSLITLPRHLGVIHAECELAFRIGSNLQFDAITLALDLTAREVQNDLKAKGHPWTRAKSFLGACPMGPWALLADQHQDFRFQMLKNGQVTQVGSSKDMVFNLQQILEHLRETYPICPGDAVLTGTPKGVGPLDRGDHVKLILEEPKLLIEFTVE